MKKIATLLLVLSSLIGWGQKVQNIALTPPMGWNSWNTFGTEINEQLVMDMADAFVDLGLRDAGYEYLVLDDGWMAKERDEDNNLVADPNKFPNGMKKVVDYVHARRLKFGIYNCAGNKTCAGYPGSRSFEYQDAKRYAQWGVDFLKYDWCNTENLNAKGAYETMRDALYATGRPILFSICEWGDHEPWKWGEEMGHMWRVTGDIINCWDCTVGHGTWSSLGVWPIVKLRKDIRQYAGPGHWNDFDMMEVGNGMSAAEDRVHFSLWAMLASPLIMGNDLRSAAQETIEILTNEEVIAVNQDSLGIQAYCHSDEGDMEIWAKPLANGEWALAFVNMAKKDIQINYDWNKHPVKDDLSSRALELNKNIYKIRDLYHHKDLGNTQSFLKSNIKGHDVLMLRLEPNNK
ncbi:glycoside hydrolase family 27 protein [Saccharicrinis fermentans]|uniref:Alpha-galactosidase n=1 Tax=Saccharicrinis fermentans DSM 9555 = JCM 21142 TaxID=869213 RepID=W7Y6F5_9BACT|nr:glycoside hydrolase family 27 protein [Saccharicrinis fermentans]GAF03787.1 alpha-galactosidase A precursor [Saccharicrinis fermentans DSM 9555 = JCM 21142]